MILVEVEVEDDTWSEALPDVEALVSRTIEAALGRDHTGQVTVLLADDAAVGDLNQRFRDRSGPTNVLSFPAAPSARPHLGDLALAYGVCVHEAAEQGKSLVHHLQHLVAHGALHLVGFDHQTDDEAERMETLERIILATLGVPDPYAADDPMSATTRDS